MDFKEFRNTLGHFATGVTVITTKNNNKLIGLTANAFSSLSLDPPLILVCIDKKSSSMEAFEEDHPFVVNILNKKQDRDCWRFAKKTDDKFDGCSYSLSEDGIPVLENNLASIQCEVEAVHEGGDHYIITGRVNHVEYDEKGEPLLFFRGKLRELPEKTETM
ncbi:flavin reductase family protein [Salibacterium aidingense]|uniref:flavin reductase family protein n=1 Tax=Salibacterium aidingense TaxID=384933 RepID=UPI000422F63C|nr:flavin reductase family protein [Salibacterium aidingense]